MSSRLPRPLFAPAAQPEIIRAAQKDALYVDILSNAVQETALELNRLLHVRRSPEGAGGIRLTAALLYHALTTGSGLQTLGEEYCDLLKVTGNPPVEPGLLRRVLLVALQTIVPFCLQRWRFSSTDATAGSLAANRHGYQAADRSNGAAAPLPHERFWQQVKPYGGPVINFLKDHFGEASRLHLALFYVYGLYYQWPQRLTGTRYSFIGKALEQRSNYRVLGMLLFLQLAISTAIGAAGAASKSLTPDAKQQHTGSEALGRPGHAVMLEESDTTFAPARAKAAASTAAVSPSPSVDADDVPSHQRCPMCYEARKSPTAAPCGHLFCWNCIAEWCNEHNSCGLCRSTCTVSDLVCVSGTDL